VDANTPEKIPRTTSERKRKRKPDDGGGGVPGGSVAKGARSVAALDNKKINEYFPKHHLGNSPIRHGGAKSPSPQQGYPMVRNTPSIVKDNIIISFMMFV
jgi:tousled-like kinase